MKMLSRLLWIQLYLTWCMGSITSRNCFNSSLLCVNQSYSYRKDKEKIKFYVTKSAWHDKTTLINCYTYDPPGISPVGRLGGVTRNSM